MKLKIDLEYDVESTTLTEAMDELEESLALQNTTAAVEFWNNAELMED